MRKDETRFRPVTTSAPKNKQKKGTEICQIFSSLTEILFYVSICENNRISYCWSTWVPSLYLGSYIFFSGKEKSYGLSRGSSFSSRPSMKILLRLFSQPNFIFGMKYGWRRIQQPFHEANTDQGRPSFPWSKHVWSFMDRYLRTNGFENWPIWAAQRGLKKTCENVRMCHFSFKSWLVVNFTELFRDPVKVRF